MHQAPRYGQQYDGQYGQYGPPPRGRALTPGARGAGALVLALLIGVELAWIVRDIDGAGLHDTLWTWLGLFLPGREHELLGTSGLDAVLLVVLTGALAASRRAGAGWAFVAAGLFAAVYRLPMLWIFTAGWTAGAPLRDRALSTGIGFVAAGAALVVIGLAGRRPADAGGAGGAPAPPRTGPAVAGGVVAAALAVELAAWQIYYVQKYNDPGYPPHLYQHLLSGRRTITALLAPPAFYSLWITAVLTLVLAVAAFGRAPLTRALGPAVGFLFFLDAVVGLDAWHTEKLLFKTDVLPTSAIAGQCFEVAELIAGLVLMVLLSLRGSHRPAAPRPFWGPPAAGPYPAAPPAGQPAPPAGAYPGSATWGMPQQQPPVTPAPPGVFGPPPNLPPNLPPQQSHQPHYGYPPPPANPPEDTRG